MTRKKNKIVFLPLMALGNESPKEFLFGVLEDLSQDLGFWSIICVISHVTLHKLLTHNKKYLKNIARHTISVHNAQLRTV